MASLSVESVVTMKLQELKRRYPEAETFRFGDNSALCAELLSLVRQGKKTATCDALRNYKGGDAKLPAVGRQDIALNWDGVPALAIETTEVSFKRFCDVDENFALAEGENYSLAGWRSAHQIYFERNGGFDRGMMLVCERFKIVEDFETSG